MPLIKDLKQMVTVRMEFFHTFIKNFFHKIFSNEIEEINIEIEFVNGKINAN